MIIRKSTCGLCKPGKKWKRNRTKLRNIIANAMNKEDLSVNLIASYIKKLA